MNFKKAYLWVLLCSVCISVLSCVSVQSASLFRAVWKSSTNPKTILLYKDTDDIPPERFAQAKHSFEYGLIETLVLSEGLKNRWKYSVEKLSEWILKTDQSKSVVPPSSYNREFSVEKIEVNGYPFYFFSPREARNKDKVIMFLHGGGFIYEMHPVHWDFAAQIVRETGLTICIPMYPIYPEIDMEVSISFIFECYRELIRRYPEAEIIMIGDSVGANLNLSLCHYLFLNHGEYADLPFPDKLILISPSMIVGNDDEVIAEMEKIEPYDVMLSMNMFKTLPELFQFPRNELSNEVELNSYTAPLYGDFSLFPPMYVFSGTYDIFYPQVKPFVERVRSQGKHIEFYTGYQMMHDWVMVPAVAEGLHGFAAIKEIIESAD